MAAMAFNPMPGNLMLLVQLVKLLPQIQILYLFFMTALPILFLPGFYPFGNAFLNILAICI